MYENFGATSFACLAKLRDVGTMETTWGLGDQQPHFQQPGPPEAAGRAEHQVLILGMPFSGLCSSQIIRRNPGPDSW